MAYTLRYRYVIIAFTAVLLNLFFQLYQGIKIVNDSYRYMEYAHEIASGNLYQEHNIWYIGYCGFLTLFLSLEEVSNLSF